MSSRGQSRGPTRAGASENAGFLGFTKLGGGCPLSTMGMAGVSQAPPWRKGWGSPQERTRGEEMEARRRDLRPHCRPRPPAGSSCLQPCTRQLPEPPACYLEGPRAGWGHGALSCWLLPISLVDARPRPAAHWDEQDSTKRHEHPDQGAQALRGRGRWTLAQAWSLQ